MAEFREGSLRGDVHHDDGRVHREVLRSEVSPGRISTLPAAARTRRDDPLGIGTLNAVQTRVLTAVAEAGPTPASVASTKRGQRLRGRRTREGRRATHSREGKDCGRSRSIPAKRPTSRRIPLRSRYASLAPCWW